MSRYVRSPGALALGILFALGTCWVLFHDIRSLSQITVDHVLTLGTLLGTIASGHYFVPAVRDRQFLAAFGLGLAFCAGTFICVTGSAGRGGEAIEQQAATAKSINAQRDDAIAELKAARAKRDELAISFAKECATGKGSRCAGVRETMSYTDSHIAILDARVAMLRPEQVANGKLKKAAEVISRFTGRRQDDLVKDLELAWPFANALIWELLTITFLSLGLASPRHAPAVASQGDAVASSTTTASRSARDNSYAAWKSRQEAEMKDRGVTGLTARQWHEVKMGRRQLPRGSGKLKVVGS